MARLHTVRVMFRTGHPRKAEDLRERVGGTPSPAGGLPPNLHNPQDTLATSCHKITHIQGNTSLCDLNWQPNYFFTILVFAILSPSIRLKK
jgi:hypothetical protein